MNKICKCVSTKKLRFFMDSILGFSLETLFYSRENYVFLENKYSIKCLCEAYQINQSLQDSSVSIN